MKNLTNMFACSNMGLSPTTEVILITREDGSIEARQGFALMGVTNFATAKGKNEDEAKENLQNELKRIAETLHI